MEELIAELTIIRCRNVEEFSDLEAQFEEEKRLFKALVGQSQEISGNYFYVRGRGIVRERSRVPSLSSLSLRVIAHHLYMFPGTSQPFPITPTSILIVCCRSLRASDSNEGKNFRGNGSQGVTDGRKCQRLFVPVSGRISEHIRSLALQETY